MPVLFYAAVGDRVPVLELMVASGASLMVRDDQGRNFAHYVGMHNARHTAWWLRRRSELQELITQEDCLGRSPLHLAAIRADREVALCLGGNRSQNCVRGDHQKLTPLHIAAASGNWAVARALVVGQSIASENDGVRYLDQASLAGRTALHLAAEAGNVALISWLKEKGASTEVKDHRGWTPLDYVQRGSAARAQRELTEDPNSGKPAPSRVATDTRPWVAAAKRDRILLMYVEDKYSTLGREPLDQLARTVFSLDTDGDVLARPGQRLNSAIQYARLSQAKAVQLMAELRETGVVEMPSYTSIGIHFGFLEMTIQEGASTVQHRVTGGVSSDDTEWSWNWDRALFVLDDPYWFEKN
ncbi:MAG: ankyrin repeat domain-containing protein [Planctomycetes bacterium]|nr:ankyrin repeat domain-containing protein [Planctomycetota bacterium]